MRPQTTAAIVLTGVLAMSNPSFAASLAPADADAVRQVLAHQTDAWNRHDMDAFVAETTPDVDWINVVGMHWRGRDAVRKAHVAFHKAMFAHSVMPPAEITDMRELAPGVALVVYGSRIGNVGLTPGGTPYPTDGAIMTMILVKTPEGWRIAHAHNTNINAMAVAHDPARAPD